jgi:hypothetical protein
MPAEFPLPSVSGSNPTPLYFEMLPEEFSVGVTKYDDGGADYKLQHGGSGVKRWVIKYDGLTTAQSDILDAWVASMFYSEDEGSAYGANFRHHIPGEAWTSTAGTLYANVHISPGGFKKSHTKTWIQAREFQLEKRG